MNLNSQLRSRLKKITRHSIFLAAMALSLSFSASAQFITISGTVYDDGNGGAIGGSPVWAVNSTQLYVYLLDNSNTIIARSIVAQFSGAYTLTAGANTNCNVTLSSSNYPLNSSNPNLGLPNNWTATAEGTTSTGDGTPDYSVAINSSVNLTVNFGIDQRPLGNTTVLTSPAYDVNGRVVIPAYAFTGNDLEDGTYTAGFQGRSVDLYQAIGGTLYYNGNLVNFSSANSATRITPFDYTLLRFQISAGSAHEFAYSIVDNADKVELVPNSVTLGTALPIKLTDFSARRAGPNNLILWNTASEKDNAGFDIERSVDGVTFATIDHVAPKSKDGCNNGTNAYTYTDHEASLLKSAGIYYRVRQSDISGGHEYSSVARVSGINNAEARFSTYPNPTSGTLSFDISTGNTGNEQLSLTVVNATGQAVYNTSIEAQDGRLSTAINLASLPAGQYYVQIKSAASSFPVQHVVLMPH